MPSEFCKFGFGLQRLIMKEEGQDLIEYGLVASLISLASVVGVRAFAGGLLNLFSYINTGLSGVM